MTGMLGQLAGSAADDRFFGVTIGIVTNNRDPDGLGRVRLRLPWLADDIESNWARLASPMAGAQRGWYSLPEVDDEVLVAFEHGDPGFPYVLGALWNGKDKPPADNGDGKNDVRMFRSRSGHVIRLTDTAGHERIEIVDRTGANTVVIDSTENTVTITADADVVVSAPKGKVKLAGKDVEIAATDQLKIDAGTSMTLNANARLTVKGQLVQIN